MTRDRTGPGTADAMGFRYSAILLLGPTGSGKTPLGECLEREGLAGRRCAHFDFGAELRAIAGSGRVPPGLRPADLGIILDSLRTGALLENETFFVARAILADFLARRRVGAADWLVLNGLPRHVGQAADVDRIVAVRAVVLLECSAAAVADRIRRDTGGDRAGRVDDTQAMIESKLALFRARSLPLLDRYRAAGVQLAAVEVRANTPAADLARGLSRRAGRWVDPSR